MQNDTESQINDAWEEKNPYSPKPRRIQSNSNKFLQILLGILLVLVFAAGITYFLSRQPTGGEAIPLQSRVAVLEQRIVGLEKQIEELQKKSSTPNLSLLQQVETLSQKVEVLQKQPAAGLKAAPSPSTKPVVSTEKQYHRVQGGETLYRISKKYGISVEELKKLNNLSSDKSLHAGQKLQVSP